MQVDEFFSYHRLCKKPCFYFRSSAEQYSRRQVRLLPSQWTNRLKGLLSGKTHPFFIAKIFKIKRGRSFFRPLFFMSYYSSTSICIMGCSLSFPNPQSEYGSVMTFPAIDLTVPFLACQ